MNRRQFILLTFSVPIVGCLPIFGFALRMGASPRLLGRSARVAKNSKLGTLATFGRIGFVALRIVRLSNTISRLQKLGDIVEIHSGENIIEIFSSASIAQCRINGALISTTSTKNGKFFKHYSNALQSSIGYSIQISENTTEHRDNNDNFVGRDVKKETEILHYDVNDKLVGTTPFKVIRDPNSETVIVKQDESYITDEIAKIQDALNDEDLKAFSEAMKTMKNAQSICLSKPGTCSDERDAALRALNQLEARFK